MNRYTKKLHTWACVAALAIVTMLYATLPCTAAVNENYPSAVYCDGALFLQNSATAVAKVKHLSADESRDLTHYPTSSLTAVVEAKCLSADESRDLAPCPTSSLTAVVKTKHLSVDESRDLTPCPASSLTAVVKVKHLSADESRDLAPYPTSSLTAVVKTKCLSADESAYTKATEAEDGTDAELSRLWERFLQILPSEISDLALHLGEYDGKKLWEQISEVMAPARDEIIRTAALLLAMIVLYTACELIPTHSTAITDAASSALSAFLAVPMLAIVISLVGNSVSALRSSSEFFGELIPIMTSVAAVGVGGGTAALTASLASVALGICDGVVIGSVYPLFALTFTLAALDSIDTGRTVASFSKGIKKLVALLSGAAPIVIGGILSLGTLISASRDTLALRGAKYALSGMVPVVGNVISGSIGALISGCKLLSGVLGPLAICAVLYYLASPLLSLLTMRFLISVAAGAAEMLGTPKGAEMLGRMRGALDAIIAPIGASALIYVFEIVIFIGTVSGVNI